MDVFVLLETEAKPTVTFRFQVTNAHELMSHFITDQQDPALNAYRCVNFIS